METTDDDETLNDSRGSIGETRDLDVWTERLKAAGADCLDLGDLVYEAKSREASSINNGGERAQIQYLLGSGCGHELQELMQKLLY